MSLKLNAFLYTNKHLHLKAAEMCEHVFNHRSAAFTDAVQMPNSEQTNTHPTNRSGPCGGLQRRFLLRCDRHVPVVSFTSVLLHGHAVHVGW